MKNYDMPIFAVLVAAADRGAAGDLPRVPDEGAVLCAVRARLQSADRLRRPAVVRPRDVLRLCRLHLGLHRQGLGLADGGRHPRRRRRRRIPRPGRRRDRHPPPGHLLRDGDAGAGADGLLLLPAGEVHRRRGRHPGDAAPAAARLHRHRQRFQLLLRRAGDLRRRLPDHLSHHPFAVRPGAEGDPRERAARHLARLSRRSLQAAGVRACRRRWPGWPAPPRRSCSSSPR